MDKIEYLTFGRHVTIEAHDVKSIDFENIRSLAIESVHVGGAGLLSIMEHRAEDKFSLLLLLSESHFSVYVYPNKRRISCDVYTCGNTVDPDVILDHFLSFLAPKTIHRKKLIRGLGEIEVQE